MLSLVRMLQANRLPALRNLVLWGSWRNGWSELECMINLLAQGASHRLDTLEFSLDAKKEWHREQLALIAAALGATPDESLRDDGGLWESDEDAVEADKASWRAFADAIVQHGAPFLQ